MMTQRDLAQLLDINVKTLRKWKKDRPRVYELLLVGLEAQNIIEKLKKDCEMLETMLNKTLKNTPYTPTTTPPPIITTTSQIKNSIS